MKCPVCGSNNGFYSKEYATYWQQYDENGECTYYGDMIDISKRKSIPLYCIDCHKRVTTLEKLKKMDKLEKIEQILKARSFTDDIGNACYLDDSERIGQIREVLEKE